MLLNKQSKLLQGVMISNEALFDIFLSSSSTSRGKQDDSTIPASMLNEQSVLLFEVSECQDVGKGFT